MSRSSGLLEVACGTRPSRPSGRRGIRRPFARSGDGTGGPAVSIATPASAAPPRVRAHTPPRIPEHPSRAPHQRTSEHLNALERPNAPKHPGTRVLRGHTRTLERPRSDSLSRRAMSCGSSSRLPASSRPCSSASSGFFDAPLRFRHLARQHLAPWHPVTPWNSYVLRCSTF